MPFSLSSAKLGWFGSGGQAARRRIQKEVRIVQIIEA
jgi:hypothetical protein